MIFQDKRDTQHAKLSGSLTHILENFAYILYGFESIANKYYSLAQDERRESANERFPGYISNNIAQYNPQNAAHIPDYFNFLDPQVLSREFKNQGFEVEWCDFMDRTDYPERMRLDGRESVGLIAKKR